MLTLKAGATWTSDGPSGGVWLHSLGWVGEVKYLLKRPGGFATVSWRMSLPHGFTHPALRQGSVVELYDGGLRIGYGRMADPDREGWSFVADGLPLQLEQCLALDALKAPTTNIAAAVTAAAGRGWPILAGDGLPTTDFSTMSSDRSQVNTLPTLLNAYCATTGETWRIDPDGFLHIESDPVEGDVDWVLTPGTPSMQSVDDDYASLVVVRYGSAAAGGELTAWDVEPAEDADAAALWGQRETFEDITSQGVMSAPTAVTNAQAILDANRARPTYASGVQVTTFQITTPGGTSAHLPLVREGHRVRQFGVLDAESSFAYGHTEEWVVGGVEYVGGERVIALTPAGLAQRTLPQIVRGLSVDAEVFK